MTTPGSVSVHGVGCPSSARSFPQPTSAGAYRRIGAVFFEHDAGGDARDDIERRNGAALAQMEHRKLKAIPPLWLPVSDLGQSEAGRIGQEVVLPWLKKHRPDVVIGFNAYVYHRIKRAGLLIPEDLAFIDLHFDPDKSRITRVTVAGLLDVEPVCMEVAIKHLLRMVANREGGLPRPAVP